MVEPSTGHHNLLSRKDEGCGVRDRVGVTQAKVAVVVVSPNEEGPIRGQEYFVASNAWCDRVCVHLVNNQKNMGTEPRAMTHLAVVLIMLACGW